VNFLFVVSLSGQNGSNRTNNTLFDRMTSSHTVYYASSLMNRWQVVIHCELGLSCLSQTAEVYNRKGQDLVMKAVSTACLRVCVAPLLCLPPIITRRVFLGTYHETHWVNTSDQSHISIQ